MFKIFTKILRYCKKSFEVLTGFGLGIDIEALELILWYCGIDIGIGMDRIKHSATVAIIDF